MRRPGVVAIGALAATLVQGPADTTSAPLPDYETSRVVEVDSYDAFFGDRPFTVSTYRNDSYRCGRDGTYPFVVVEPADAGAEDRPLWVLLHGGGLGYYADVDGRYHAIGGGESANDAESAGQLLRLLYDYAGADGSRDTFVADRLAAGDRFLLGSLCDHDLYLGIGQVYPHNPNHDDTVDGLLADLAMIDAVTKGTSSVSRRPTASLWVLGVSAGAFGAYALTHNLWSRGVDVDGLVLDSGLLVERAVDAAGHEWVSDGDMIAKNGPYLADPTLWIDSAVAAGFDIPLFDTVEEGDAQCSSDDSTRFGCAWLHDGLAAAIAESGHPLQEVHVYSGNVHMATTRPSTAVQDDLRAWYAQARSALEP